MKMIQNLPAPAIDQPMRLRLTDRQPSRQWLSAVLIFGQIIFGATSRAGVVTNDAANEATANVFHDDSAQLPLIRASSTSAEEANGYASANQRRLLSIMSDSASEEASDHLNRLLERAQEMWLAGSMTSAQSLFSQIVQMSLQEDWREAERETVIYAQMRLAQIAKTATERDRVLKSLAVFDSHATLDPSLFPPPLVERLNEIKAALASQSEPVNLKAIFAGASFVRINGQKWELAENPSLLLAPGIYRVSVFSDQNPKLSKIFTRDEIIRFDAMPAPAITGSCDNPRLAREGFPADAGFDVIFPQGCVRSRRHDQWVPRRLASVGDSATAGETPAKSEAPPSQIPSEWLPHPEDRLMPNSEIRETSIWDHHQTWVWIGVSVIALGAAYAVYQNQRPSVSVQPTHGTIQ